MFDQSDIQRLVRNHFGAIFTTSGPRDFEEVIEVLDPVVSNKMNSHLQALVTDVLLQKDAKQLGGLKAPCEDGFSSIFYHELWPLVGALICNTVRSFFKTCDMPPKLNKTLVTLILKTTSPRT
ncbi:reverse transcriptase [Artemisia annua]|uniref:Reverse transcriptase n=1 Tax=Artemisia annua TaxID=35608 RepID=A0A2U1PAW2_ARTAN|nr:reverse transcriptase [Artemisia annua]